MSAVVGSGFQLAAPAGIGATKVTQLRVVLAEWTKFRSLRSTVWTLLVAGIVTIGFGALFSAATAGDLGRGGGGPRRVSTDAVSVSLGGVTLAQLSIGVLGVLLISGEYSTGMIKSSLAAVPRRLPMLWAKIVVFAAVAFVVMIVATFVAFFLGQGILSSKNLDVGISAPGALRSVIGAALSVTVAGIVAMGLGGLMRNTAAAISTFVAVFFVIPPLAGLLPTSWTDVFLKYLPSNAGAALYGGGLGSTALAPWAGFAVLCGYAAIIVAIAAVLLRRRDA